MAQGLAHLGGEQLWLVAQTKKRFAASESFSGACDREHFVRAHRMCAWFAGIAAEGAISAVVPAEIGQRKKYLARVCNDAGIEALFDGTGGDKKFGKLVFGTANEVQRRSAEKGNPGPPAMGRRD